MDLEASLTLSSKGKIICPSTKDWFFRTSNIYMNLRRFSKIKVEEEEEIRTYKLAATRVEFFSFHRRYIKSYWIIPD